MMMVNYGLIDEKTIICMLKVNKDFFLASVFQSKGCGDEGCFNFFD
jgi:hypothetical protein